MKNMYLDLLRSAKISTDAKLLENRQEFFNAMTARQVQAIPESQAKNYIKDFTKEFFATFARMITNYVIGPGSTSGAISRGLIEDKPIDTVLYLGEALSKLGLLGLLRHISLNLSKKLWGEKIGLKIHREVLDPVLSRIYAVFSTSNYLNRAFGQGSMKYIKRVPGTQMLGLIQDTTSSVQKYFFNFIPGNIGHIIFKILWGVADIGINVVTNTIEWKSTMNEYVIDQDTEKNEWFKNAKYIMWIIKALWLVIFQVIDMVVFKSVDGPDLIPNNYRK